MPSLEEHLRAATESLHATSPTARLDAEVLLAHLLRRPRSYLRAHADGVLSPPGAQRYAALIERRAQGEPVAYLTGVQEFWSLPLRVTPDTLIPRPDTELLVEAALRHLPPGEAAVADLGTGTGAVAIALAGERPQARVVATERSPGALAVARENVARHAPGRVELRAAQAGWFDALGAERFDLIVSNPPYIPTCDPHLDGDGVRYEPRGALAAGRDGLDELRALAQGAPAHLARGGWLLLEHGHDQGEAVQALLRAAGLQEVATLKDLAGLPRVTQGRAAA